MKSVNIDENILALWNLIILQQFSKTKENFKKIKLQSFHSIFAFEFSFPIRVQFFISHLSIHQRENCNYVCEICFQKKILDFPPNHWFFTSKGSKLLLACKSLIQGIELSCKSFSKTQFSCWKLKIFPIENQITKVSEK